MKEARNQFSVSHVITPQLSVTNILGVPLLFFSSRSKKRLAAALLNKNINHLAILVYGSPQIVLDTLYLGENLF
jgi:hypothetical protein